jgi:hypothetical protein
MLAILGLSHLAGCKTITSIRRMHHGPSWMVWRHCMRRPVRFWWILRNFVKITLDTGLRDAIEYHRETVRAILFGLDCLCDIWSEAAGRLYAWRLRDKSLTLC